MEAKFIPINKISNLLKFNFNTRTTFYDIGLSNAGDRFFNAIR